MPEYNYYRTENYLYRNTDSTIGTENLERSKSSINFVQESVDMYRLMDNLVFEPITEAQAVTIILTGDLDA